MRMSLTDPRYLKSQGLEDAVRAAVPKIEAIPGVEKATATCCVPLEGGYGLPYVDRRPALPPDRPFHGGGGWATQSYGFFDIFKIPIKKGRVFNDRDTQVVDAGRRHQRGAGASEASRTRTRSASG